MPHMSEFRVHPPWSPVMHQLIQVGPTFSRSKMLCGNSKSKPGLCNVSIPNPTKSQVIGVKTQKSFIFSTNCCFNLSTSKRNFFYKIPNPKSFMTINPVLSESLLVLSFHVEYNPTQSSLWFVLNCVSQSVDQWYRLRLWRNFMKESEVIFFVLG